MRQPVRVLLIDDSIFTLYGLKAFLSEKSSILVVGTARTEAEAFAAIEACRPDVVVLDVRVGEASGIDMCRVIGESYPEIAVLFFAVCGDRDILHSAILAGAQGYILKNASGESITKSIELVSIGQAIIDQRLTQQIITWVREGSGTLYKTMEGCRREDLKVLSLVAAGMTNKEIAQELNMAVSTATTCLRKIYKRVRVSRKAEAARYFAQAEKGLVH